MGEGRIIVFVCTGNVCRSPMAEYIFRDLMADDAWECTSAGTSAWDGQPASENAVKALAEWGIDLTPHRSRRLRSETIDAAALLVTMTRAQRDEIALRYPAAAFRARTLREFDLRPGPADITDPIGEGMDIYRHIRDDIRGCLMDLVLHLKGKKPE